MKRGTARSGSASASYYYKSKRAPSWPTSKPRCGITGQKKSPARTAATKKTCDALYALQLTLTLLERYPPPGGGRKQIERLRQLEPHLPPLQELCIPQPFEPPSEAFSWIDQERAPRTLEWLTEDTVTYLLSTVVNRLRQFGVTVAQSCDVVDRILTFCFDQPDGEADERPARLAQQWRRLH